MLQAVRLKGQVRPADLASTLGVLPADLDQTVAQLVTAGLLTGGVALRMSRAGRDRLAELLAEERQTVDPTTLAGAYDKFRRINRELKALVTDWQLKDGQPNTHHDAQYDQAVLARLDAVHQQVLPIIATTATQLPRLSAYARKLSAALAKVHTGQIAWLTRPLLDSYHTVWFELHEELMGAVGLSRESEAKIDIAHEISGGSRPIEQPQAIASRNGDDCNSG